ncbi:MAG: glycosyltransferase [Acidobacteriota bacterium]
MGTIVPTIGWLPRISNTGIFERWEHEEVLDDPTIRIRRFPLQRGFARIPIKWLAREGSRVTSRLASMLSEGESSTLICCSPHYAAVACRWSGPVVYYVTDLFVAWGENPNRIRTLERRLCAAADLVCPDSQRIADYLVADANCNRGKIVVLPMATRAANLLSGPVLKPAALPEDIADLPRPIAGVLGNLANNIDWVLLQEAIRQTPWLSWALIGPTAMGVLDLEQERARAALMAQLGRVRFTGYKPYGTLRDYARAFDVAVLPYRKIEPTYSGSSTRFYEHLATCRPMLATRGFEELLHKEPLLRLANSTEEMVKELELLAGADFHDGFEEVRWKASQKETWEERALAMKEAIATRLHAT